MELEHLYDIYRENQSVSTDSRSISPGQIFFALRGPNFDGNTKAFEALDKGASWAVIDDASLPKRKGLILVQDVLTCLQGLASFHRQSLHFPVLGITGSNGKTTTKELLMEVLSSEFSVEGTKGNFNNHIGVPLTILNTSPLCDFLVVEMGSNQPGDIAFLCEIARPGFGMITNIGQTHLEKLKTVDGVFQEKIALFESIKSSKGIFFKNNSDTFLAGLNSAEVHCIDYSESGFGEWTFKHLPSEFSNLNFQLKSNDQSIEGHTALFGNFNLINITAALCIGNHFGVSLRDAASAIESYIPTNMRSQIIVKPEYSIVMDGYNANPSSMVAAVQDFVRIYPQDSLLILGDMLELGEQSKELHRELAEWVVANTENEVILVGKEFSSLDIASLTFVETSLLIDHLKLHPVSAKQIFIKGSRSIRLENLLEVL